MLENWDPRPTRPVAPQGPWDLWDPGPLWPPGPLGLLGPPESIWALETLGQSKFIVAAISIQLFWQKQNFVTGVKFKFT